MKSRFAPIWLTRLVLAVYLATVPLYGMAATVVALACQSEATVGAVQETHHHSQAPATSHEHVAPAEAADPAGHDVGDGASVGHLCCQVVVTALPSQASLVEPETYSPLPSSPGVFHYVTFLERFQRPPLG